MKRINKFFTLSAVTTAVLTASTSAQTVHYSETFPRGATADIATVGWQTHVGSTAIDRSSNTAFGDGFVVASSAGIGTDPGFLITSNLDLNLTWTNEFSPLSLGSIVSFSIFSASTFNSGASINHRFAIRVDTTWYATDEVFNDSVSSATFTSPQELTFAFTLAAAEWRPLTMVAGDTLELGASTLGSDLSGGKLTAAGILTDITGGDGTVRVRLDDYSITAIPEPNALALLLGAAAFSLCLGRRSVKHNRTV